MRFHERGEQPTPHTPIPYKQLGANDSSHYLYQNNINILTGQDDDVDDMEMAEDVADENIIVNEGSKYPPQLKSPVEPLTDPLLNRIYVKESSSNNNRSAEGARKKPSSYDKYAKFAIKNAKNTGHKI